MHETEIRSICCERGLYETPSLNSQLFLNACRLKEIPRLDSYVNVTCIFLNNNFIREMSHLGELPYLKSIFLQDNEIREISGLFSCRSLQILDLTNNRVDSIAGISNLINLTKLILKKNAIQFLDDTCMEELSFCSSLATLDLSDNPIKSILNGDQAHCFIEFATSALPNVRVLDFNSPLINLPSRNEVFASLSTLKFFNGSALRKVTIN